jgi:ElaB/YqjD/DUF883 family membrane-anchored ribosome-binding protein
MEAINEQRVNKDIEAVREDVRRVREDVAAVIGSARLRTRGTIMEMGNRIRGVMTDIRGRSDAWRDRGHETVENWRGDVERRPFSAVLLAFTTGFVIASVISWGRHARVKTESE